MKTDISQTKPDTRIVYGTSCTWWGTINEAASPSKTGIPVPTCPHCACPLYEARDRATWNHILDSVNKDRYPNYREVMEWQRETGRRCGLAWPALRAAYDRVHGIIPKVIRDICELPDRTSPDDQPDMLLVTRAELEIILKRHLND